MSASRVVAIGQPFAGDDAVAFAVTALLRAMGATIEVIDLVDPMGLVELVAMPGRLVIVDALLGGCEPGRVHCLTPGDLATRGLRAFSSHAMGVREAVALGQALYPDATPEVTIVGVEVAPPARFHQGLSPEVARAVDRAARAALDLTTSP